MKISQNYHKSSEMQGGKDYVYGTFIKDEVFNSEFQPSDLPDGMSCEEYVNTTYDAIRASDEAYLAMLSNMKEKFEQGLPEWKENTTN